MWLQFQSDNFETHINSLAPGRPGCHFKTAIVNLVLLIAIFTSSNDNALRWMPWDLTDDKSTLVQVMAWCRQATSHYLSQCWPSSMSPYGVTRPQWVKDRYVDHFLWNCPHANVTTPRLWLMNNGSGKPLPEPMLAPGHHMASLGQNELTQEHSSHRDWTCTVINKQSDIRCSPGWQVPGRKPTIRIQFL